MLAIDKLRPQFRIELAVLEELSRHFSYQRGFRVTEGDVLDKGGSKVLNRSHRRWELRAGDQDHRGTGISTFCPLNDEAFLLELVDFLNLRREKYIDRRTLFDLFAEGLRRPIDDSHSDIPILCFKEWKDLSKCILQAIGRCDCEGLRRCLCG